MSLLLHNMDFQLVNNATLSSAIYLMLAYSMQGNTEESNRYYEFIKKSEGKLEADEPCMSTFGLK